MEPIEFIKSCFAIACVLIAGTIFIKVSFALVDWLVERIKEDTLKLRINKEVKKMNEYQEAMNYLWNAYDENKIYGIASRGYLDTLQELVDKAFEWIPVTERLPEEYESAFAKYYGTDQWTDSLWRLKSKEVLVCIEYDDGSRSVTTSFTLDGKWRIERRRVLHDFKVIAWMPLPEPMKEEEK